MESKSTARVKARNEALDEKARSHGWKSYSEFTTAILNEAVIMPAKSSRQMSLISQEGPPGLMNFFEERK